MKTDGYISFEWDSQKAATNYEKHGVNFEDATAAFSDPYARIIPDSKHSDYEERFFLIGMDLRSRVLTVCHCVRGDGSTIRIISARQATKTESKQYWGFRND